MAEQKKRTTIKCVVVGDSTVGKTSLLITCTTGQFPMNNYVRRFYDDFTTPVTKDGKHYTLNLFDTAGQEEFHRLRPLSYHLTDIFIVCFSLVSPDSLMSVSDKWVKEIGHYCPEVPYILVGTRTDLRDDLQTIQSLEKSRQNPITFIHGETAANEVKAVKYLECSALKLTGLKEILDEVIVVFTEKRKKTKKIAKCELL